MRILGRRGFQGLAYLCQLSLSRAERQRSSSHQADVNRANEVPSSLRFQDVPLGTSFAYLESRVLFAVRIRCLRHWD